MTTSIQQVKPEVIEAESFRIIESEFEERTGFSIESFSPAQFAVIRRVIHATGDFAFAQNLTFHPQAINTAIEAIRAGKRIVTDVQMVAVGISDNLLRKWGCQVECLIATPQVAEKASREGKTRSETAIAKAMAEKAGIIAIGNAPTALLAAMELQDLAMETGRPGADLIVGVPVGFVNAAESKDLLSEKKYPFITTLGRKGGSTVAAAIVNALIRLAAARDED